MKRHPRQEKKRTFASIIPGLEPTDGGSGDSGGAGKERRTTNEGGEGIGHDLVAPSVLDGSDALNGILETPGETHLSLGMSARGFDPAVEILMDLSIFALVVWSVGDERLNTTSKMSNEEKPKWGECSLSAVRIDNIASRVDRGVPIVVDGVPSESIVRDRHSEATVRVFLELEDVMFNLTEEGSVGEIRPSDERRMRVVGRSRVSQSPLVTVHKLLPILKAVVSDEEPLFPSGTVLEDILRLDLNLLLEVFGGFSVVGYMVGIVAGTVVVHGGFRQRGFGFR